MAKGFTPVWKDSKTVRTRTRPAAAAAGADAESGAEAANETQRQALWALKVMLDRGHMTKEEYDRRLAAILDR